ncbi:MAG: hypothetical protein KIH08_12015 [Candidatus Freyarchaeota archaeon]|nr:hypothetical protein [Candidatus Jordarchaeia archaeon]MBS7267452.1 hypothetical protein [Candidatus Jordarchaeia archaeon]
MFSLEFLYSLIWYGYLIGVFFFAVSVYFLVRFRVKGGTGIFYLFACYVLFGFAVVATAYGYYQHVEYFGLLVMDLFPLPYIASQVSRIFYFEELTGILLQYFVSYVARLLFKWNVSMMIVAVADFFLFAFTVETFIQRRKYLVPFGVASAAIVVYLALFWDPLINWATVMILSLVTYCILAYFSIRAMRLAEKKSYKYGFGLIASSNILLSLFFVFMAVDRLTGRWTPFLFLAWTILFLSSLFTFVGYTMPPWFKKLFGET